MEKVTQVPGKRAKAYLMMFPAGEQRKRVQAALYSLEQDGVLAKACKWAFFVYSEMYRDFKGVYIIRVSQALLTYFNPDLFVSF